MLRWCRRGWCRGRQFSRVPTRDLFLSYINQYLTVFRLPNFYQWRFLGLMQTPWPVECAHGVEPFKPMRAEEIALCLDHVGG